MQDFRLKVFLTAAKTLNFTRCAEQLNISQPAVSRHISELESYYGTKLFSRQASRIELTESGRILEQWSGRILSMYMQLEHEIGIAGKAVKGQLRIGASTTIAQYILPPVIARFRTCYPDITITLNSANSQKIELDLLSQNIDLGFVENLSRRSGLNYRHFADDRLVVATSSASPLNGTYSLKHILQMPMVVREKGSGTLELMSRRFSEAGYSLSAFNIVSSLGSSEAIKSYLKASNAITIISMAAIRNELRDNSLKIIEIKGINLDREFCYATCHGEQHTLANRFINFAINSIYHSDNEG